MDTILEVSSAIRFLRCAGDKLLEAIETAMYAPFPRKKIWELYRVLIGLELPNFPNEDYFSKAPDSKLFKGINDWTDDIDTEEEHRIMNELLLRDTF